jgi:ATP-dependent helicase/nuclease subunit A
MEYTQKQKRAVESCGRSVLVSAAAGSGKTSVLTGRIVSLILKGADIQKMLVTTFTNAAAGEMKARIARALLKQAGDKRMREQAERVSGASIGTFHSLCSRIIRENYDLLGISRGFHILDEKETQVLRAESMEELLDDLYEAQDNDFLRVVSRYTKRGSDDGIARMVFKLHDFSRAKPDPQGWLRFAADVPYETYRIHAGGDSPEIKEDYAHTMPDVHTIVRMTERFDEIYAAKKAEKNGADYDDLLLMALRVLKERPYGFDYIFVDEYQDTNPVQEEIIRRLAREDNLFMVGDIKQSIYKFNLADPDIFLKKAAEFKNTEFAGELLCMNENFRSAQKVVDAVNGMMEKVMSLALGEIEYAPEERLVCKNGAQGWAEALLCEAGNAEERNIKEAVMIADKIEEIVRHTGGEPDGGLGYGDVTLLVRSRSEFSDAVKKVFQSRGIPLLFDLEEKRDIPELDLFHNILRIVENPMQDVPLLSVLRTFVLSENELAAIRLYKGEGPFYKAAEAYAREMGDAAAAKLNGFFEKISYLKTCEAALTFRDFIEKAAEAFDFDAFMLCASGGKKEAFIALKELCANLADAREDSLYLVNRALADVKKREGSYVKTKPAAGADAVRLMTMHRAKGLEFPVVFCCNLHRQFNMRDLFSNEPLIVHSEMGILPNYVDADKCVVRPTFARQAAVARLKAEYKSEDLRVLYVAMTRAKNMLFLCGCVKEAQKAFENWESYASGQKEFAEANCMLDWVMGGLPENVPVSVLKPGEETLRGRPALDIEKLNLELEETYGREGDPQEFIALPRRIKVPAKLSVSEIKKQAVALYVSMRPVLDESEITGAKLGTLVHAVMEHIGFEGDSAMAAAGRLFDREIITQTEREAIEKNAAMIDAFFKSGLAGRIKRSKKVIKEMPFNLLVPAGEIGYASDLSVTVQGVLDLAFMEGGQWVLVDYKTDYVPGDVQEYKIIYEKQLSLYANALSSITGVPVKERWLCFLRNNRQVQL